MNSRVATFLALYSGRGRGRGYVPESTTYPLPNPLPEYRARETVARALPMSVALCALFLLLATGCSSGPAVLNIRAGNGHAYTQSFDNAYAAEAEGGQYDAVLTSDGRRDVTTPGVAPPVPLDQVLHVRVLWQPLRGTKTDTPSATNAAITWYVRRPGGMLLYQGAGFVVVHSESDGVHFSLRDSDVSVKDRRGAGIDDPLGKCSIVGDFFARRDAERVRSLLADMQRSVSPPMPTTAPSSSPPSRDLGTP